MTPPTRDFHATVQARARHDHGFLLCLVDEARQAIVEGDFKTAQSLLRDCVASLEDPDKKDAAKTDVPSRVDRIDVEIMPDGQAFLVSPSLPGVRVRVPNLKSKLEVKNLLLGLEQMERQLAERVSEDD